MSFCPTARGLFHVELRHKKWRKWPKSGGLLSATRSRKAPGVSIWASARRAAGVTRWHGPYFDLTWKEKDKTISRRLAPEQATLYCEWAANRQRLQSIIQRMQQVSRRAQRYPLWAEKSKKTTPKPRDIASSYR